MLIVVVVAMHVAARNLHHSSMAAKFSTDNTSNALFIRWFAFFHHYHLLFVVELHDPTTSARLFISSYFSVVGWLAGSSPLRCYHDIITPRPRDESMRHTNCTQAFYQYDFYLFSFCCCCCCYGCKCSVSVACLFVSLWQKLQFSCAFFHLLSRTVTENFPLENVSTV